MISIDVVCVCTYMWPCIVCILVLFNSKSCPKSCTAVGLQSYGGRRLLLQGKKSISVCCKPSWIRCHCTPQAHAQVPMPTHVLSFSDRSLRAIIVVWQYTRSNFSKKLSAILKTLWHRMKAESCSHGWYKFVEGISLVNLVLAGLMPDQVSSCSLHSNFVLDQLPSVLLQLT